MRPYPTYSRKNLMALSPSLVTAFTAVAEACRVTRAVQTQLQRLKTLTKEDLSPVTVADFAAQAIVCLRLASGLGRFALVGEETADDLRHDAHSGTAAAVTEAVRGIWPGISQAEVLAAIDLGNHDASADTYWTLDPVDGTKGFLRGGQYAVSLALIERGQVVAGVLGCPNLGQDFARPFDQPDPVGTLFYAQVGGGAFGLAASASMRDAQPIHIVTHRPQRELRMCESVEAGHSRLDYAHQIRQDMGVEVAPARLDSQCKYAVVARGQADVYLRLPTRSDYVEKIWDHAAGALIASEAGARVTDIDGRALDFSRGAGLSANRGIVCAAPEVHPRLLDAIAAL